MEESQKSKSSKRFWFWLIFFILIFSGLGVVLRYEIRTSAFQSSFFSEYSSRLSYKIEPGKSSSIVFPKEGPYNKRRGYTLLPQFIERLEKRGFQVVEQAKFSPELVEIANRGITPPYKEPSVTGLTIYGQDGVPIYNAKMDNRLFRTYDEIPPILAKSLMFIEDRELDSPIDPRTNPVVNWERFAKAGIFYGINKLGFPVQIEGGSTLATQLEKFRYSGNGNTSSVMDKFRQMFSASIKVYKNGMDTRGARKQIILEYINSAPLAAAPGYGEIYGLGEGLQVWFGEDLKEVSRALASTEPDWEKARAFLQALKLLCAVRAPTYYIIENPHALEMRVRNYINLFEKEGIIDPEFAALLHKTDAKFSPIRFESQPTPLAMHKASNVIRNKLLQGLGISDYYTLERIQLEVETTLDIPLQAKVTNFFHQLEDKDFLAQKGLRGKRLLSTGDASEVIYSFRLFEITPHGNALRVNTDNYRQPFDLNEGMKLELGSTAKLRTLAHYLEIVALLYKELSGLDEKSLKNIYKRTVRYDTITSWTAETIRRDPSITLDSLLDKALKRKYSGSPAQFFTGGGLHSFGNFSRLDNSRIFTVEDATAKSTNLVFIRIMRDLVRYHKNRLPYDIHTILKNPRDPKRLLFLQEIAEKEATHFLSRFYKRYRNLPADEIAYKFLGKNADSLRHLTILFFAWYHGASEKSLGKWLSQYTGKEIEPKALHRLYKAYSNPNLTISDYGFLLRRHPLEVWSAGMLRRNPRTSWEKLYKKSEKARQVTSSWLFKTRNKGAQNRRLRIRFEQDAFARMTPYWKRLGFPFYRLVPSYSTAIGSSCDRPAALAELMGIIANNGMKRPSAILEKLKIAEGTPYHTIMEYSDQKGERVMEEAVAKALKRTIAGVVERGTAGRLYGAFRNPDGTIIKTGGKTGSGDNRLKRFNRYGGVIRSKAINRTATYVFFIGDHYFGVITAFVPGAQAEHYEFTSALPVSILKLLAPLINERIATPNQTKSPPFS